MRISIFRKEHFNAAHRLHNPRWSQEKNQKVYGLCNSPNYHGHNYTLIVKLTGQVNKESGYLYDMKKLSTLIKKQVTSRYDHKNLNLDLEEFQYCIPTTEHFARIIYERLLVHVSSSLALSVTLYETENNYVQYPA